MKHKIWVILSVLIILFAMEFYAYNYTNKKFPLYLIVNKTEEINNLDGQNTHIPDFKNDPSLAWSLDFDKMGLPYQIKNNCIFFENQTNKYLKPLKIFITGGSTSDLTFQNYNWPILLYNKLKEQGYNFQLYIGAVSGYNTTQEFLKLYKDGMNIENLDIHISYFGANDYISNPDSQTESDDGLNPGEFKFVLLPNLMWMLKLYRFFGINELSQLKSTLNGNQTFKMLKLMHGVSIVNHHKFIPVFQPLAGVGSLENAREDFVSKNPKYYQQFDKMVLSHRKLYQSFSEKKALMDFKVYDLTGVFYPYSELPIFDNCHVKEKYQHIISDNIYLILRENGLSF